MYNPLISYVLPLLLSHICDAQRSEYPSVGCPDIFQYSFDPTFGGYFGLVTVQRNNSPVSDLQINMTLNTGAPIHNNINISVLSTRDEIFYGDSVRYAIRFPVQEVLPKLTLIKFNDRVLCKVDADPLQPGIVQTSMWARSTITTYSERQKTSQPVENPQFFFTFGAPPSGLFGIPKNPFLPATTTERATTTASTSSSTTTATSTSTATTISSIQTPALQCGVTRNTHNLIIGGDSIASGEFPWLAAILYNRKSIYKFHCTGNLISERHVLTAGHCVRYHKAPLVDNEDLIVVLGTLNIENWARSGTIRTPAAVVPHPSYKQDTADYDLALIVLKEAVRFKPTIRPICLWRRPDDLDEVVGRWGTVVGWNRATGDDEPPSLASKIEMPVVSQETCLRSHKVFNKYTSSRTFCAGNRDGTRGPCAGDSGAGFMIREDSTEKWYLRGLVGYSIKNPDTLTCDLSYYNVFIDIAKMRTWIETEMEKN